MDTDTLAKLRAIADKATPGPWMYEDHEIVVRPPDGKLRLYFYTNSTNDGQFTASFNPSVVKAMLDVVEAAQAFTSVNTLEPWDEDAEASYQGMRDAIAALAEKLK